MERTDSINLKTLNLDELAGVVNLYPWYGAARRELCVRMARMGGDAWDPSQYADAALYLGNRRVIRDIATPAHRSDYADKDLEKLLRAYISEETEAEEPERPVRVVGGDYFSQAQYDKVRRSEDNVFSRFVARGTKDTADLDKTMDVDDFFCTETLAQIFADQGRYVEAKRIYSKLLLKFPEKSAYFATLIEKLGQEI